LVTSGRVKSSDKSPQLQKPREILAALGMAKLSERYGSGLDDVVADGVVDQQEAVDLLLHPAGSVGAQHHAGGCLVGLELIKRSPELPPLGIQPGQVQRGCLRRVEVPRTFRTVHPIGWTSGKVK